MKYKTTLLTALLALVIAANNSYTEPEDINDEIIRVAQYALQTNKYYWFKDENDVLDELDKVTFGIPTEFISTDFQAILELEEGNDFLSICSFIRYEVPIILKGKGIRSVFVEQSELNGERVLREAGGGGGGEVLDLLLRLQLTYPQSSVYHLLIIPSYHYYLIFKENEYFIIPVTERSAYKVSLRLYKLTPLSKVMPKLKAWAAEMEQRRKQHEGPAIFD